MGAAVLAQRVKMPLIMLVPHIGALAALLENLFLANILGKATDRSLNT